MSDALWLAQVGGCKTGLSAVLWLARVGGCVTGVSDVFWLAQVVAVRIGVWNILLKVRFGLLQETIESGWLCGFPGTLSLPAIYLFSCLLGALTL